MTAMKTMDKAQERKPLVRYQFHANPEWTRLVLDFNKSQQELLGQVMELLLQGDDDQQPGVASRSEDAATAAPGSITKTAF